MADLRDSERDSLLTVHFVSTNSEILVNFPPSPVHVAEDQTERAKT